MKDTGQDPAGIFPIWKCLSHIWNDFSFDYVNVLVCIRHIPKLS